MIEHILRHLGLWKNCIQVRTARDPPAETFVEPWLDDPFPDYDNEPVMMYADD